MGSELPMGGIRGLGKKERGRRRRNVKREVRKTFKVVAGVDLQGQLEFLAAKVEKQAGITDAAPTCYPAAEVGMRGRCANLGRLFVRQRGDIGGRARSETP